MSDAEIAMLFELGAAVITALAGTGIALTFAGMWRYSKKLGAGK